MLKTTGISGMSSKVAAVNFSKNTVLRNQKNIIPKRFMQLILSQLSSKFILSLKPNWESIPNRRLELCFMKQTILEVPRELAKLKPL